MDHISKALERARAERRSVRDWVQPDRRPRGDARANGRDLQAELAGPGARVDLDQEVLAAHHVLCGPALDNPVITDKYRLLRTRVLQPMKGNGWCTVGVTSPSPRAGKTLNAINLAMSTVRDGNYHVVVIDADLRQPAVARTLGLEPASGIADYLTERCALQDVLISPAGLDNLTIVPGRSVESNAEAPDFLRSRRMAQLISSVQKLADDVVVIVDLPPVLIGDDVIAVAPLLDCMLLVIDEGVTDLEELKSTAELLKDCNLLGTVLNRSTERRREAAGYYQAYHG